MPSHERTTYCIETSPAGTGLSNNPDLDLKVFHRLAGFAEPFLLRHVFLRFRGFHPCHSVVIRHFPFEETSEQLSLLR